MEDLTNYYLTRSYLDQAIDLLQRVPDRAEPISEEFSDEVDDFLADFFSWESETTGTCINDLVGAEFCDCCPLEDDDPGDCCDTCSCDAEERCGSEKYGWGV